MATQSYPGAAPPPPGVTPNLEHPREAGRSMNIAVMITVDVLVCLFLFIRLFTKAYINRHFLVEDATCIIGAILILLYSAVIFVMTHYREGYHQWEVSQSDYDQFLKWLYVSTVIYIPCAFAVKTTLLLLIARVFAVRRKIARGIYVFISVIALAYIPIQLCKTFVCIPINSYWRHDKPGKCLPQRRLFLADISVAILTDLAIMLIPIPLTWKLKVPWKRKVKIFLLLAGGGFATAITIYRMVRAIAFLKSVDVTHDFVSLDCLTIAEVAIGFLCSCAPSANLLWCRVWQAAKSCRGSKSGQDARHAPGPESEQIEANVKSSTFNTELALLSGGRDKTSATTTEAGAFHHETASSINSSDGRREGWLAQSENGVKASGSGQVSDDLIHVSKNQPWQHIWDGREKE